VLNREVHAAHAARNAAQTRATCASAVVQAAQAWARGEPGADAWLRDALRTYEDPA